MKDFFETQLTQLDDQLENMPRAQRLALFVLIPVALIGMGYFFIAEALEEQTEFNEQSIARLERTIAANPVGTLKRKIAKAGKEALELETKIETEQARKRFLQSRLERNDFVIFDQYGFAKLLDRVLKESVNLSVQIDRVDNEARKEHYFGNFWILKKVQIEGSGSFRSIVSLVRFIEAQKALLKMEGVTIRRDGDLEDPLFRIEFVNLGVVL